MYKDTNYTFVFTKYRSEYKGNISDIKLVSNGEKKKDNLNRCEWIIRDVYTTLEETGGG